MTKLTKIFLFILLAFFITNFSFVSASEVTGSVTVTVTLPACITGPTGYIKAASENSSFTLPATNTIYKVAFGCNTSFNYTTDSPYTHKGAGTYTCNNTLIGGTDPAQGVLKACFYAEFPTVSLPTFTNITPTTATLNSNITDVGNTGAIINERGFYWYIPGNAASSQTAGTGSGAFSLGVTGLTPNTLYRVYSWGKNEAGNWYTGTQDFTTTAVYTLTVTNTGQGTVTSSPSGISCGATCTKNYNYRTSVRITASAVLGYSVAISNGCTASGTIGTSAFCDVSMTSAKTVAVAYTRSTNTLTIVSPGNILSPDYAITAPVNTTRQVNYGANATVTAEGWAGYTMALSGGCTATGAEGVNTACTISNMTSAKTVTVTYTVTQKLLTVTNTGQGTVTSSPSGISCGATCTKNYNYRTSVRITASAVLGYSVAISNGCTASGTIGTSAFCDVSMTSAKTVAVAYTRSTNLVSTSAGTGGSISPTSRIVNYNTTTTFTITPDSSHLINSVTGCGGSLSGSTYTTGAITSACTVTATFTVVTVGVTASPTTYNTIPNTNVSILYTPTTNTGNTECRLLDYTSTPLPPTTYKLSTPTNNSITFTPPVSAGAYGYYVQCRNKVYTTVTATSALITVKVFTISVTANPTTYNVAPGVAVNFTYAPTSNPSGATECLLLDNLLAQVTTYKLSIPTNNSITYIIPNNIGSYGYYVKCRNTTTTTAMATSAKITVNTACANGTSWNGTACVGPSGTLTASDCKISAGESSCNSNVSWTINNPVAVPTAITASGMTDENVTNTLATPQSGIKSLPVPYPSRKFYLYNNGEPSRADDVAYATCTDTPIQTFWDGSKCVTPDGTLSVSPCTVQAGNSSCNNATLDWSITNPIGNSRVDADYGISPIVPSIANTSGQATFSLEAYREKTISLYSGIFKAKEMKTTAICWDKTTWNGSICELNAPKIDSFTAEPSTIFEGRASTLSWSADPDLVTSCTGEGFSTGTGSPTSGSVNVSPVVTTIYKITCGRSGFPSASSTAVVKVIVLTIKEQ